MIDVISTKVAHSFIPCSLKQWSMKKGYCQTASVSFSPVGVSFLIVLQCSDNDGWVIEGQMTCQMPVPLNIKDSVCDQVKEDDLVKK